MITPANSTSARLSHLQDCKQAPWCNWSQKPALTGLYQELSTVIHGSLHNHVFVGRYQCDVTMLEALHVMGVALEKAVVVIGERHGYETSPRTLLLPLQLRRRPAVLFHVLLHLVLVLFIGAPLKLQLHLDPSKLLLVSLQSSCFPIFHLFEFSDCSFVKRGERNGLTQTEAMMMMM